MNHSTNNNRYLDYTFNSRIYNMSEAEEISENKPEKSPGKLIMDTFYMISNDGGAVTAKEIVRYLRTKFGESWRRGSLQHKVEEILRMGVDLGYLEVDGDQYIADLARRIKVQPQHGRCRRCHHFRQRRRRRRCRYGHSASNHRHQGGSISNVCYRSRYRETSRKSSGVLEDKKPAS